MSLKIYYSDRIEELAKELKMHLLAERKAKNNPFEFAQVVVPNTNIAKWLQIRQFADEPSFCMGIEFPFIEQSLYKMLAECLELKGRPQLLPMHAYANGIMSILLKDNDARLTPFRRYVAEGDGGPLVVDSRSKARMAWQLAIKLADLMDAAYHNRADIRDLVAEMVNTYHPNNPPTIVKDGAYTALTDEIKHDVAVNENTKAEEMKT